MYILACTRYFTSRVKRKIRYLSVKFLTRREGLKDSPIEVQIVSCRIKRIRLNDTFNDRTIQSEAVQILTFGNESRCETVEREAHVSQRI